MRHVFETPSMRYEYHLLDRHEVDGKPLIRSNDWGDNLLALLTPVEQERVLRRVEEQIRQLKGEEQRTAARIFVILAGIIGIAKTVVRRLKMIDVMENEVLGPAVLKGEATIVARLLEKRFGALPEWVAEKLGSAKEAELLTWADRVLSARTLNDVFKA